MEMDLRKTFLCLFAVTVGSKRKPENSDASGAKRRR